MKTKAPSFKCPLPNSLVFNCGPTGSQFTSCGLHVWYPTIYCIREEEKNGQNEIEGEGQDLDKAWINSLKIYKLRLRCQSSESHQATDLCITLHLRTFNWICWGLNPGPSACQASILPLSYGPSIYCRNEVWPYVSSWLLSLESLGTLSPILCQMLSVGLPQSCPLGIVAMYWLSQSWHPPQQPNLIAKVSPNRLPFYVISAPS